jgi:hypothetical protein
MIFKDINFIIHLKEKGLNEAIKKIASKVMISI